MGGSTSLRLGELGLGAVAAPCLEAPDFHRDLERQGAVRSGCWACLGSRRGWTAEGGFIQFVESAHDPVHPLLRKIAYLVAAAATGYGRILGAEWLRLMDPLPGVLGRYEEMGFRTVREKGQVLYCERRIEP